MSSEVAAFLPMHALEGPSAKSHFGLPEPISVLPALGCMAYLKLKHPIKLMFRMKLEYLAAATVGQMVLWVITSNFTVIHLN